MRPRAPLRRFLLATSQTEPGHARSRADRSRARPGSHELRPRGRRPPSWSVSIGLRRRKPVVLPGLLVAAVLLLWLMRMSVPREGLSPAIDAIDPWPGGNDRLLAIDMGRPFAVVPERPTATGRQAALVRFRPFTWLGGRTRCARRGNILLAILTGWAPSDLTARGLGLYALRRRKPRSRCLAWRPGLRGLRRLRRWRPSRRSLERRGTRWEAKAMRLAEHGVLGHAQFRRNLRSRPIRRPKLDESRHHGRIMPCDGLHIRRLRVFSWV